ncbi:hypothetical protein [Stackebrandtia soli]|uniref:hypothetical protein n=1 Tax=Stackebrandtia soli TaxID=1892856 RepID=UPI0039EC3312
MTTNAAEGVIAAIQSAIQHAESTTAAIKSCDVAAQHAHASFAVSGGSDKMLILDQIAERLRMATGMEIEMENALREAVRLAGVLSTGQPG